MRVVSQNGYLDYPYELINIYIRDCISNYQVVAQFGDDHSVIAEYKTKEKALESMQDLRNQYKILKASELFLQGQPIGNPYDCKETIVEIRDNYIFQFQKDGADQ